jgi:hypothetical protein
MITWPAVIILAVTLAAACTAGAATLGASAAWFSGQLHESDLITVFDTAAEGRRTVAASVEFEDGGAALRAEAAGDLVNGVYSAAVAKSGGDQADGGGGFFSNFVARGSGSVDFFFDVDGAWDVVRLPGSGGQFLEAIWQ